MPLSWEQSVFSSNVSSVGYDAESKILHIRWSNGRESTYENVPEEKALHIANAPSVGKALNSEIKGNHPHSYVK